MDTGYSEEEWRLIEDSDTEQEPLAKPASKEDVKNRVFEGEAKDERAAGETLKPPQKITPIASTKSNGNLPGLSQKHVSAAASQNRNGKETMESTIEKEATGTDEDVLAELGVTSVAEADLAKQVINDAEQQTAGRGGLEHSEEGEEEERTCGSESDKRRIKRRLLVLRKEIAAVQAGLEDEAAEAGTSEGLEGLNEGGEDGQRDGAMEEEKQGAADGKGEDLLLSSPFILLFPFLCMFGSTVCLVTSLSLNVCILI
jgi:hypothetical protein